MLSPHEFATLMLVRHAPDQLDMNRGELDALLENQLVMLENSAQGVKLPRLTGKGNTYLNALHPGHRLRRRRNLRGNNGEASAQRCPTPVSDSPDIGASTNAG